MKKTLFHMAMAAMFVAVVCSCSSKGPQTKEISPTRTEFSAGDLAKYVEVVDEPSELTFVQKEGGIASQVFTLKVKLRLKGEISEAKDIDEHDISFTRLLSGMTIDLVDESETKVLSLELKDDLELKKLLKQSDGTEAEITFETTTYNSDDAPGWFESAAKFSPELTADVQFGSTSSSSSSDSDEVSGSDTSSSSSSDFSSLADGEGIDEALDALDDYVSRYVSFMKKADYGDPSAMAEYQKLMEEAEELGKKLDDAKGNFTPAQMKRYEKISMKMVNSIGQ